MDINNFKIYRSNNLLVFFIFFFFYLYFELLSQSRCFLLMRYDINKDCYELNHSKSTEHIFNTVFCIFQAEDTPVYELIIIYCCIIV